MTRVSFFSLASLACASLIPPLQYAHRSESVPAAGGSEAFQLEIGFPFVGVLEPPAAVFAAGVADDFDGFGEARVARGIDGLEVIESAQNVVMPSGREREAEEKRLNDFTGVVGAKETVRQEKLAAATLGGLCFAGFVRAMQFVVAQAFERADGGMDRGVRCAGGAAAIPSAVGHLLLEQVVGYGVEASVVILKVQVSPRRVHFAQVP